MKQEKRTETERKIETERKFYKRVLMIAVPVTLQSLLQSSFGMIDQVMTGQLGSSCIAGIGLASRFVSVFTVLTAAIAAVAGIMTAQYIGKEADEQVRKSFWVNLSVAGILALLFTMAGLAWPERIMQIYTKDAAVIGEGSGYLRIVSLSFIPAAVSALISPLLRCMEAAALPLYAGIGGAVINTVLNYGLIFGKAGLPALGSRGAAAATAFSQLAGCVMMVFFLIRHTKKEKRKLSFTLCMNRKEKSEYFRILLPILICEFAWGMGENVYGIIYGHVGTMPCAAMTLTGPVQGLMIGALTGISQAAGVIIGKSLGSGSYEKAYQESKKLMLYGLSASVVLSFLLLGVRNYYVEIYPVEETVKVLASQILAVYALIAPVKIQNMILGGGVIRSGGETRYVMWVDIIGTWVFGVPLGFLAAFVLRMEIPYVYLMLSLEECVRLGICFFVFRTKKWMKVLGETK